MPKAQWLLDVNILLALAARDHIHHKLSRDWFYAVAGRPWAMCAFTESGFLRHATAPRPGQIKMSDATAILKRFAQHPGYRYLSITDDWHTLCAPFAGKVYGTNQVTDAYLLGLAVREGIVLATMDRGIEHLAGEEYRQHVLLLEAK